MQKEFYKDGRESLKWFGRFCLTPLRDSRPESERRQVNFRHDTRQPPTELTKVGREQAEFARSLLRTLDLRRSNKNASTRIPRRKSNVGNQDGRCLVSLLASLCNGHVRAETELPFRNFADNGGFNCLPAVKKERQEEEPRRNARFRDSVIPYLRPTIWGRLCWMFVSFEFSFSFQVRTDSAFNYRGRVTKGWNKRTKIAFDDERRDFFCGELVNFRDKHHFHW